jgi:hypothetical protein
MHMQLQTPMEVRPMHAQTTLASFLAVLSTLVAISWSHAAQIVPVSQVRMITADSIVAPILQQDFQSFTAPDFGLFDKTAKAAISNSNAVSDTVATQFSTIDGCAVTGSGSSFAHSLADADGFHGYSLSSSTCHVVFDVDEAAEFLIAGTLQAASVAQAQVMLQQQDPATLLFQRKAEDESLGVHHRITLTPGRYIITFSADSSTASNSFGEMTSGGEYDMVFTLCFIPADVNVDGEVNVADLLAVINGWGACPSDPEPCAADIDLNGMINVADLLAVINAWGS